MNRKRLHVLVVSTLTLVAPLGASVVVAPAARADVVSAIDNDPENKIWNCAEEGRRVPFGNTQTDQSRCITFRYRVPSGGITSAYLYLAIDTLGADQDTDAVAMAVGAPFDDWCKGQMPGCVTLHGGFVGKHRSLNLNLLDIACDTSIQGSAEKQKAVRDQLNTGVAHFLLQDDTALFSAQLTLNQGPPSAFACGSSESPVNQATGSTPPAQGGTTTTAIGQATTAAPTTAAATITSTTPATPTGPFGGTEGCSGYTATPIVNLAQAVGTIPFWFQACGYMVRGVPDYQRGTATLEGQGVLSSDGQLLSGNAVIDIDHPLGGASADMGLRLDVLQGSLADDGAARVLRLRVRVNQSTNPRGLCPVGSEGTLTLIDADAKLANGMESDGVLLQWPASPECNHEHGWNNTDRALQEPTRGGRGGGMFADVRVGLGATQGDGTHTAGNNRLETPPLGTPEPPPGLAGFTILAGQRLVREGETVYVPVWLVNAPDVASINATVTYRSSVVAATDAKKGSFLDAGTQFAANTNKLGSVLLGAARSQGLAGTGVMANLAFRAVGKAGDRTTLAIEVSGVESSSGQALPVDRIEGSITIVGPDGLVPGDCDGDSRLTEPDARCALEMSVQLRPASNRLDMNGDQQVTARDATLILQKRVGR